MRRGFEPQHTTATQFEAVTTTHRGRFFFWSRFQTQALGRTHDATGAFTRRASDVEEVREGHGLVDYLARAEVRQATAECRCSQRD